MTQASVGGPLAELHLGYQLGLDEDGLSRRFGSRGKRGARPLQRAQQTRETCELVLVEAAADTPREAQRPVLLVNPQQQRPDGVLALALARHPPTHHELLASDGLDLDPAAGAQTRLV